MVSENAGANLQTIYLDESHLSNLAKNTVRPDLAQKFKKLCGDGRLAPVFSMAHLHETWKHQSKAVRDAISNYADSLPNCKWILSRHVLIGKEIERLFIEVNRFSQPPLDPLREKLKHVLYEGMQEPIEIVVGDYGFHETLAEVEKDPKLQRNFEEWKSIDDSYPSVKAVASAAVGAQGFSSVKQEMETRFQKHVAEKIPDHFPNGAIVKPEQKTQFLKETPWKQFQQSPTTYLLMRVDQEIARDIDAGVGPSQFVDLVHLASLPYVDIFLCDKRSKDYVRRAQVPSEVFTRCFYDLEDALDP